MFSYIYADGNSSHRGLTYYMACETEAGINRLALDYIRGMALDYGNHKSPLLRTTIDAVESKDVSKAIDAWNDFARIELKQSIARHAISPFTIVE